MACIHHHAHLHFSTNKQNLVSALEDFKAKRMEKLGSEDNSWVLWSRSTLRPWLVNKWGCDGFSTHAFPRKQIKPRVLSSTFVSCELAESSKTVKPVKAGKSCCSVPTHRKQAGMLSTIGKTRKPRKAELKISGTQTLSWAFRNPLTVPCVGNSSP